MSDVSIIECDTCGERTEDAYEAGWHQLKARRTIQDDCIGKRIKSDRLHFCSLECLIKWAETYKPKKIPQED